MLPALIKTFGLVAVNPDTPLLDAVEVNKYAMKCGYFVHPDACTPDVIAFLKTRQANLNSTFYKEWQDVARRSELEMRILQMVHYATTYGTDYQGRAFTMNPHYPTPDFAEFTLLMPCTPRQLFDRIAAMLTTPGALSDELLDLLCEQLRQYHASYGWTIDIDSVGNREAQLGLCDMLGLVPENPESLIRLLVFKTTGKSLIIKNDTALAAITANAEKITAMFLNFSATQLEGLASVFYRYKPIFLALRQGFKGMATPDGQRAAAIVNRLRKLAPRFHRPLRIGVLESILNPQHSLADIQEAVKREKSNLKLIRVINYLRSVEAESKSKAYIIRNGKLFVAPVRHASQSAHPAAQLSAIIIDELAERLRVKAISPDGHALTVRFPENIELAAPTSERQFVGNVPFGSAYRLRSNNLIGIYWRNEWGTRDFDLWLTVSDGRRLGWAANHKDDGLLFSGDMTDADPEATEIFYGRGESWPDSIISVARYNGEAGSRFRLFFASDNLDELPTGYMVRPDSILFSEDIVSDAQTTAIGIVTDRHLYFGALGSGKAKVPNTTSELDMLHALSSRLSSSIPLRTILLAAGFREHDPSSPTKPDIDLSKLNKDTLLGLMQ